MHLLLLVCCLQALLIAQPRVGGEARWIWRPVESGRSPPAGDVAHFRRDVDVPASVLGARAWITCDDEFVLWIDGRRVVGKNGWSRGASVDLKGRLRQGRHTLAVRGRNGGGPAALLLRVEIDLEGGQRLVIVSDARWLTSAEGSTGWRRPGFDTAGWEPARDLGALGSAPWGAIAWSPPPPRGARRFEAGPGFRVETLAEDTGSLDALCLDDEGRVLAAVEGDGVLRITPGEPDDSERSWFTRDVKNAQGLLWLDGGLLVVGHGPRGPGLYRVGAPAATPRLLGGFEGGMGEHGPHAIIEGPDDRLYVVIGNHTRLAGPWSPESPYSIVYEGHLLPRYVDPRGHAASIEAPGGIIVSLARDGSDWRVIAGGFRNAYDIAFDRHGRLFTYDSDMEWDAGLPWYRPTVLHHVVPGADYGWRTGASKWPYAYPDCLPPVVEVGRGSPVGLTCYDGKSFPARLHGALLGGDWSRGLILAWKLRPEGSSYRATTEVLLRGRPLNVTDLVVDAEGRLVFTTGGRRSRGGVYRLAHEGPGPAAAAPPPAPAPIPRYEASAGLPRILADLGQEDRRVRYVAARELERRPVAGWAARAVAHAEERARGEALVALARLRLAGRSVDLAFDPMEQAITLGTSTTDPVVRVAALRAVELFLQAPGAEPAEGRFTSARLREAGERLLAIFPTGDRVADRVLANVLAWLAPDGSITALLDHIEAETSRREQIHHAYALRAAESGWTPELRVRFIRWLRSTRQWPGGASLQGYLARIRKDMDARLEPADRARLGPEPRIAAVTAPARVGGGVATARDFDRTLEFLERALDAGHRSVAAGAAVFRGACAACHPCGTHGGNVGPDLGTVAARFTEREILEAIMAPDRVISDQYRSLDVFTKDGDLHSGMPIRDDGEGLVLLKSDGEQVAIERGNVDERRWSRTSAMPSGIADGLTLEELADLFAFLRAEQRPAAPVANAWRPLFDGRTLVGWMGDETLWRVESGVLIGELRGRPGSSFLISRERFSDFVVQLEVQLLEGNSGLQFRSQRIGDEGFVLGGYQADMGQAHWGSLYEERGRGLLLSAQRELWQTVLDPLGWNHFTVVAEADHLQVFVNGEQTADVRDSRMKEGHFGLQLHGGMTTRLRVRHLRIRPLRAR